MTAKRLVMKGTQGVWTDDELMALDSKEGRKRHLHREFATHA